MTDCTLSAREPGADGCHWCGAPLSRRQKRWCSEACARQFPDNHWWTAARHLALIRGAGLTRVGAAMLSRYRLDWHRYIRCDQCGTSTGPFEVNHVVPRNGAGYDTGCWNHQTNLQVLCHTCHVAETTRQRRERPIWDAFDAGVITSDEAQIALDRAYWWKRGLPDPDAISLWGATA